MKVQWEKTLTKAAEDGSSYLHALMLWSERTHEYRPDYILILALTNRARIRHVLELIKSGNIPSDYDAYKEQLTTLWSEAEDILKENVFHDVNRIRNIISANFSQRLNSLKDNLKRVRRLAQDGDLTGDYDWIAEDLRETAHDFLLSFRDMALTNDELQQSPLKGTEEYFEFKKEFNNIDQLFKKYFGYFHTASDLLLSIKEREYGMDYWWLNIIPNAEEIQEEEIPETLIKKLQDTYKSAVKIKMENCPEKEPLIAYALGELAPDKRQEIRSHILECRLCLDLVADVRYAEAVSKETEEGSEAFDKFFEKVRIELLHEEVPAAILPLQSIVAFLTSIALRRVHIRALQRRVSYEEEEREALELLVSQKMINLKLKKDEAGKYTLPQSPEKECCDFPEDYKKINDFIGEAETYWGGFAIKIDGSFIEFEPDLIRDLSLSRLIKLDPKENYKSVIIGIAGKQEDLQEGLKALKERDEKTISSLNVVWLICSLE